MADINTAPHLLSKKQSFVITTRLKREYRWVTNPQSANYGYPYSYVPGPDGKSLDFQFIPRDYIYDGICQRDPNKGRPYRAVKIIDPLEGDISMFKWMDDNKKQ